MPTNLKTGDLIIKGPSSSEDSFLAIIERRKELVEQAAKLRGKLRSSLNAALKEAGFRALEYWHAKFAPKHFEREALREYAPVYGRYYGRFRSDTIRVRRKNGGWYSISRNARPLFLTGNLRSSVLRTPVRGANLTGTSKQTSLRLKYEDARNAEGRTVQEEVSYLIAVYGMSRFLAIRKARQTGGYSAEMKKRFQECIAFVSPDEQRSMMAVFERTLKKELGNLSEKVLPAVV